MTALGAIACRLLAWAATWLGNGDSIHDTDGDTE